MTRAMQLVLVAIVIAIGSQAVAAPPVVKDVKVTGDASKGSINVSLSASWKAPEESDIVFLYVAAGQDEPQLIAKSTQGKFDGKVPTAKSWASVKDTQGNKPIPIRVYAVAVYTEKQAIAWINNHAAEGTTVHTWAPK